MYSLASSFYCRENQSAALSARSDSGGGGSSAPSTTTSPEPDGPAMHSLTGNNASGWKFQDSFYGILNIGRRPSLDMALGQ